MNLTRNVINNVSIFNSFVSSVSSCVSIVMSVCNHAYQEKMMGHRGKLRALAGICHVHESYF